MPDEEEMNKDWTGMRNHKLAKWVQNEKPRSASIDTMLETYICTADIQQALEKAQIWKSPGPDELQNFLWKNFSYADDVLANCLDNPIKKSHE